MSRTLVQFRRQQLVSVSAEALVLQAQMKVAIHGVHHLLVFHHDEFVGVICSCDLEAAPERERIAEYAHEPITLSAEHTFEDAVELMNECDVGSVVLLDNETPCGIVTRGDLAEEPAPPELKREIAKCDCCGTYSHLRTSDLGRTLCLDCRKQPRGAPTHLVPVRDFQPSY